MPIVGKLINMIFKSRKDILFTTIFVGLSIFLIGVTLFTFITAKEAFSLYENWPLILILGCVGFLLWLFFGTNYELSEDGFIYRFGPMNGKISVSRIKEIVKGKTLWMGFRPATARKGLIIKYDQYNEIYISPKTNESFIIKILELNSNIKITE
jgi:hypothetical protein